MVSFRGRQAGTVDEPDVNVDIDGRTGFLQTQIEPLANCVRSIIEANFDISIKFSVEQEWSVEFDLPNMVEITGKQISEGGPFGIEDEEGEIVGEVDIFLLKEGDGTKISIRADVVEGDKESFVDETATTEQEMAESILGFIRDSPRKAALGYGPTHPLDNIEPVSMPQDYTPTSIQEVIDKFKPWIKESLRRTEEKYEDLNPEHGFYTDTFNNTVGIYQGEMKRIRSPPRQQDKCLVTAHTHPSLESAAAPSASDILNMGKGGVGSYHIIANASEHTQFYLSEEKFEERVPELLENDVVEEEEVRSRFRPITVSPVLGAQVISIDNITSVDDYVEDFKEYMINTLEIQKQHKLDAIRPVPMDNQIKELIVKDIERSSEGMKQQQRDDDSDIIQQLMATMNTFDVAFQFERDFIEYR